MRYIGWIFFITFKWQIEASSILLFTAFPHHYEIFLEMALLLQSNNHHPGILSYQINATYFQQYQFPVHIINPKLDLPFNNINADIMKLSYNFEKEFLTFKPILDSLVKSCHHLLNNEQLLSTLRSQKYVLLILDLFANDVCALTLARKLEIPVVGFWPRAIGLPCSYFLGTPSLPSFVPATGKGFQTSLSFPERISNLLAVKTELDEWNDNFYNPLSAVLKENFSPLITVNELYGDVVLVFTNEEPVIDVIRPTLPNVIPIGGFDCQISSETPKYMEDFIKSFRGGGVAFVHIKYEIYLKEVFREMLEVLKMSVSAFPLTGFIWNEIPLDANNKTNNILAVENIHYHDVLGLSRTRLFISTCDKSSILSSLFHGVPLLCIPISIDQWDNANRLNEKHVAIVLDKRKLTVQSVKAAIQNLLADKKFSETARNLSMLIREKPEAPSDLFMFWVNYIIRHKTIPHLMNPTRHLTTMQYYNLDIAVVVLILTVLVIIVIASLIYLFTHLSKLKPSQKITKSE